MGSQLARDTIYLSLIKKRKEKERKEKG